ncbi:UNVERIFIED_CONTAM: putative protein S-acyltransferase 7 [Sesamum calycinum]|uniref:Protein S-acyltransferase n=1 Tax=Sesamum calycinum TaxID=2727403 RepID=A0AAW2MM19_9LAMI
MDTEQTSIWRAMIKTPASIVLIVYTFIAVWFVGGLTAFHLYLISTNQCILELGSVWSNNKFCRSVAGGFVSPNMGKAVEDIEMGRKAVWGDVGSVLDHPEGQLSDNDGLNGKDGGLGEMSPEIRTTVDEGDRAGIHPRRSSWGRKSGSWEMSPEVLALASRMGEPNRTGGSSSTVRSTEPKL